MFWGVDLWTDRVVLDLEGRGQNIEEDGLTWMFWSKDGLDRTPGHRWKNRIRQRTLRKPCSSLFSIIVSYFDKISCICATHPCICSTHLYDNGAKLNYICESLQRGGCKESGAIIKRNQVDKVEACWRCQIEQCETETEQTSVGVGGGGHFNMSRDVLAEGESGWDLHKFGKNLKGPTHPQPSFTKQPHPAVWRAVVTVLQMDKQRRRLWTSTFHWKWSTIWTYGLPEFLLKQICQIYNRDALDTLAWLQTKMSLRWPM